MYFFDAKTKEELRLEGFPILHSEAFLKVAKMQNCVIMCRTPGIACEMLLAQDYDGKGFFIKSKSCNWGPMAGFVCLDPRLNKKRDKGAFKNLKCSRLALSNFFEGKKAGATPLIINQERIVWLKKQLGQQLKRLNENSFEYIDGDFHCYLIKSNSNNGNQWALYYNISKFYGIDSLVSFNDKIANTFINKFNIKEVKQKKLVKAFWDLVAQNDYISLKGKAKEDLNKLDIIDKNSLVPVMGLVNPHLPFSGELNHLNAVTGDYDLYAIWPKHPSEDDYRVAGMSDTVTDDDIISGENISSIGRVVGNISNRIYFIAQLINSLIPSTTGKSPNRIFHSDEVGRPFIDEVDSAAVFTPDGKLFMLNHAKDLAHFIEYFHDKGYTCFINKGWKNAIDNEITNVSKKAAWSVRAGVQK